MASSLSSACGEDGQDPRAGLILKSCLLHGKRSCLLVGDLRPLSSRAPRPSRGTSISINGGLLAEGSGWRFWEGRVSVNVEIIPNEAAQRKLGFREGGAVRADPASSD